MAISIDVMESTYLRNLFLKGKTQGWEERERSVLLRQLQHKFGDLPASDQEKISKADLATLEKWSLQILDAKSLKEIFDT